MGTWPRWWRHRPTRRPGGGRSSGWRNCDACPGTPNRGFGPVRDHAAAVGARWLEAQARQAMSRLGGNPDAEAVTDQPAANPPQLGSPWSSADQGLGDPPVLWLVT